MGLFRSLSGTVRLELTSADVAASVGNIVEQGIPITEVEQCDDLTVCFAVSRRSLRAVEAIADRKGERLKIRSRSGWYWTLKGLLTRPALLAGAVFLIALVSFVPGRVLFVSVEGNQQVPARMILEAAQTAGIRFGASRRAVRSEKMKNELLGALPQLQWAGVNTYGCSAVISVRERTPEERGQEKYTVSSIIAAADGVITSCTVTSGNPLCSVGQAVKKGQMLVSGYADLGQTMAATRSSGEIFALTDHCLTAVTPAETMTRTAFRREIRNFAVQIGKKRINFKKGSGIYDGSCVKMYAQYYLTLPGGWRLPVSVIKETVLVHDVQLQQRNSEQVGRMLSDSTRSYLRNHSIALTVLDAREKLTDEDGVLCLTGNYSCTEMIGREQGEQIGEIHGKTD